MAEEGEPQLRGIDLLMSVEKKQKDELRQKRKSQKRTISASSSVGKDEQTAEDVEVVEVAAKDSEETQLEEIIFGGDHAWDQLQQEDDLINKSHLGKTANKKAKIAVDESSEEDSENEASGKGDRAEEIVEKKPAWQDEDDELLLSSEIDGALVDNATLSSKLREKHERIFSRPKWAVQAEKKARDAEADQLLRTTSAFVDKDSSTRRPLPSGLLDFTRCPQMNKFCFHRSPLVAVEFHPSSEIAMIAHKSGVVTFLNVDAKECNKIQSVFFKDFDISCAKLSHDGMQLMVGSAKHRTLHCYDLMSGTRAQVTFPKAHELTHMKRFEVSSCGRYIAIHGRYGNIYVINAETKQQLGTLKMNEDVTSTVFTRKGQMLSHGGNYVYLWDIGARRCVQKFLDDGCLKGEALALSPDERFLATGCDSGIVNVYDASQLLKGRDASRTPKPLKCVKNIVTPITSLTFNPSSEILLASSRYKPEAVKMVHTGSMKTFANFPNAQHKFHSPSCATFSPNGGFLAVGATVGAANLLRINHYSSY